jgi:hypothetical protein
VARSEGCGRACVNPWDWNQSYGRDSRKLKMPGTWNVCWGKLQAASRGSLNEWPCGMQPAGHRGLWSSSHTTVCPEAGHWAIRFYVCPAEFWYHFHSKFPCCFPVPPFGSEDVYLVPKCLRVYNFFFFFVL